ncbi:MAG TPA: arginase family protein [Streptosporangiaceae bacterium]
MSDTFITLKAVQEVIIIHRYAILEAPSALGHVPEHLGVERAPGVLLADGLSDGLAVRRAGRVEAAGYSPERDPATQVMNPNALNRYSRTLADAVGALLDQDEFPVVLGGDCSILLGTMLALRRRGRYGLMYIDADADFYQPEVSPLEGAASASDLAFATGRGPDVVADIEGRGRWSATRTSASSRATMPPIETG